MSDRDSPSSRRSSRASLSEEIGKAAARPRRGPLGPGAVFAKRYRIVRHIAQGGMGTVWEATETTGEGRSVALKLMKPRSDVGNEFRARFRREAALTEKMVGQGFTRVYASGIDEGLDGGVPFIAMELLVGETLSDRLKREAKITPRRCRDMMRQLGAAIEEAHSVGVIHRDLTPKNLFWAEIPGGGGLEALKILDFGLAKDLMFDSELSQPGVVLGSPHYMSPEQARHRPDIDTRSDLWSIGALLYRCLLGRRPFVGQTRELLQAIVREPHPDPTTFVPLAGPAIDAFFRTALAKDPDQRFQDIATMVRTFEEAASRLPEGLLGGSHGHSSTASMRIPSNSVVSQSDSYSSDAKRVSTADIPEISVSTSVRLAEAAAQRQSEPLIRESSSGVNLLSRAHPPVVSPPVDIPLIAARAPGDSDPGASDADLEATIQLGSKVKDLMPAAQAKPPAPPESVTEPSLPTETARAPGKKRLSGAVFALICIGLFAASTVVTVLALGR